MRDGHNVLLYATGDSAVPGVELRFTYDRHLGVAQVSLADELRHVMDAYEAADEWGADVVHDHTMTGPVWSQVHSRLPVVTTNHGPFDEPLRSIYRRITTSVPVIAISHHQASTARGIPVHRVIHHGLDTSLLSVGPGDGGYGLFLGRMSEAKGVHTAVRVARAAGIPLKIAAKMREPGEIEYFRTRVEPLPGGEVEYLGEVGPDDKHALLRDAVCLLNPIAWPEPFGMVMIEALARGTPVVGTPCGAAPEIVDDGVTGFLRAGPQGLVDAIAEVDAIDRAACRAAVVSRFSMERMAADHLGAYAALLEAALLEADRLEDAEISRFMREEEGRKGDDTLLAAAG